MATKVIVSGKVQGVYYRGWTEATARSLGLTGWVRNLRTGEVEMLLDGPAERVCEMIRRCHDGPAAARVDRVRTKESEDESMVDFSIRPSA